MKFITLTIFAVLLLSTSCAIETKQCGDTSDCFAGESCVENRCLTQPQITARKKNDAGGDQSQSNGNTNNGTENNGVVQTCVDNGTLNVGEDCDPQLDLTKTCENLGYDSGTLKCTACQFDTSNCNTEASTCGDGSVDGVEACDGDSFDGKTCESEVGKGSTGVLSCSDKCGVNTSKCSVVYISISASSNHTCAVNSKGRISCWGANLNAAAIKPLLGKFVEVSTGDDFSCGLKRDGGIVCWGNEFGRNLDAPEEKFEGSLSSSSNGSCALKPDKTVSCWGFGYSTGLDQEGPFTQVSAGGTHACGVSEGVVSCWSGSTQISPTPEADDNSTFTQVEAGYNFSCALMSNNNIVCWKTDGTVISSTPAGTYTQISVRYSHACALGTDQKVTCWGYNNPHGEDDVQTETFSEVSAGRYHSCGITVDGEIKCWGKPSLIEIP